MINWILIIILCLKMSFFFWFLLARKGGKNGEGGKGEETGEELEMEEVGVLGWWR